MAEGEAEAGEWANLTQAARRLGWPRERLRSAARRNAVQHKRAHNSGELLILLTADLLAQAEPAEAHGSAHGSKRAAGEVGDAVELRDRLAALEAALDAAEAGEAGLRVDLAAALGQRDKAVEAREVETRLLREALDRERAERAKLAAELAEARKPLLVRLLEAVRRR